MNFCGKCGHPLAADSPPDLPAYANRSPREYTPPFLLEKVLVNRTAMVGERKHVTVFFADVTGFTTLSETLDPEAVHDVMDGCFEILGQEIHGAGGTINQYTGDGVMALYPISGMFRRYFEIMDADSFRRIREKIRTRIRYRDRSAFPRGAWERGTIEKQGIAMLNKIENAKSSRLCLPRETGFFVSPGRLCVSLKKPGAGKRYLLSLFGIVLFVIIICDVTHAGVIKIRTQTTLKTTETNLEISVTLFNDGSDPAQNLQVHAKRLGKTIDSKILPELGPGKSTTFVFDEKLDGVKPGRYPLTIVTDFHDTNQYPFSAISGMTFSLGPEKTTELAIMKKDSSIEKKGKLFFNVKNIGEQNKQLRATLVLPRELSSPASEQRFELPARDEKSLVFDIQNFSALSGADYPVFCYFEYDQEGIHHTAVSNATIGLITEENLFRRYRWVWMILIAALVAAFLVVMARQKKRMGE